MTKDDGIINTFQQRRQLEEAIAALAAAQNEAKLIQTAREIVDQFPADLILAGIQRHLGDANSQLRGGLGHLCALLPPDATVPALRAVAANRQKTPVERTTAVLILERYLGEAISPGLLGDLAGTDDVAFQSLIEAVEEARSNRHILLEYVTQMEQHGVDVAFMVLDLLDRLAPHDRVELLRLIAQDARPQVANAALARLVALAGLPEIDAVPRALHTLTFSLPPALASQAERTLRKLQFSGQRYQPPPSDGWRALMSAADPGGYFSVWVIQEPREEAPDIGVLLGFVLGIHEGILQFFGNETMERSQLPTRHDAGQLVEVGDIHGQTTVLLEIPFAVGRWLVLSALDVQWQKDEPLPLPGEYRLYNDLLWQHASPVLPAELAPLFAEPESRSQGFDMGALASAAEGLLKHPIMASWLGWATSIWSSLQPFSSEQREMAAGALTRLVLQELDTLPHRDQLMRGMATGLRVQALWLTLHQEPDAAGYATLLSHAMEALPAHKNPLLVLMLEKGLGMLGNARGKARK